MNKTGIEWCDMTSNPLRYRDRATGRDMWACVKTSPGCRLCYAEALALRFDRGGPFTKAEMAKVEPYLCDKELHRLLTAKKLAGKRVFLGDMTDIFGDWVPDALLDRMFAVMALRPDVTFQVLTKRADRMRAYLTRPMGPNGGLGQNNWCVDAPRALCKLMKEAQRIRLEKFGDPYLPNFPWPIPNLWLGVSVENRRHGLPRIDHLRTAPAALRFLSIEPLLEDIGRLDLTGIGWVICGGESGIGARTFDLDWARSLRDQCAAAGVPFFFKQMGENVAKYDGLIDVRVRKKGGELDDIPADLRIREYPEAQS